jgi:hypothetical protein
MSAGGSEAGRAAAHNGSGPYLVPVPVGAERGSEPVWIDEALDRLVDTVDDLAHDLESEDPRVAYAVAREPESERPVLVTGRTAAGGGAPETWVHSKAFVATVIAVLIVFELLVLMWLLSGQ